MPLLRRALVYAANVVGVLGATWCFSRHANGLGVLILAYGISNTMVLVHDSRHAARAALRVGDRPDA